MYQQLVVFIEESLVKGSTKEEIKSVLMKEGGWTSEDIEKAFSMANPNLIPQAKVVNPTVIDAQPNYASGTSSPIAENQIASQTNIMPQPAAVEAVSDGQILSFGQLFEKSWASWKNNYKLYFTILAIPVFVEILLEIAKSLLNKDNPSVSSVMIVVAFMFVQSVVAFFAQIALFYAVSRRDTSLNFQDAYAGGIKKTFSYIWIIIISSVIVSGGYMFFFVPGILFSVWFSLGLFILFAEDVRGMDALLKSKEYLRGFFGKFIWRTFLLSVVFFLVSSVVALILFLPIFILSLLANALAVSIIIDILFAVIGATTVTISLTFMFLFLENLRQIKGQNLEIKSKKWPFVVLALLGIILVPIILMTVFSSLAFLFMGSANTNGTIDTTPVVNSFN